MALRLLVRQAEDSLAICRGHGVFFCSGNKKELIVHNARRKLAMLLIRHGVQPTEINTSWEELDQLIGGELALERQNKQQS